MCQRYVAVLLLAVAAAGQTVPPDELSQPDVLLDLRNETRSLDDLAELLMARSSQAEHECRTREAVLSEKLRALQEKMELTEEIHKHRIRNLELESQGRIQELETTVWNLTLQRQHQEDKKVSPQHDQCLSQIEVISSELTNLRNKTLSLTAEKEVLELKEQNQKCQSEMRNLTGQNVKSFLQQAMSETLLRNFGQCSLEMGIISLLNKTNNLHLHLEEQSEKLEQLEVQYQSAANQSEALSEQLANEEKRCKEFEEKVTETVASNSALLSEKVNLERQIAGLRNKIRQVEENLKTRDEAVLKLNQSRAEQIRELQNTLQAERGEPESFYIAHIPETNATELLRSEISTAATEGSISSMKNLLSARLSPNLQYQSKSPLYLAASSNRPDMVRFLLDRGADIQHGNGANGWTALHISSDMGHVELVGTLLDKGAECNARNSANETALDRAAYKGRPEVLQLLINRGCDLGTRDKFGYSPLHSACFQADPAVVKILLGKGSDIEARDNSGFTPLHLAADKNKTDIAKTLLTKGANVNARNDAGETPTYRAAWKGFAEMVKLLLAFRADVNIETNFGGTPLSKAQSENRTEVVNILRDKIHG